MCQTFDVTENLKNFWELNMTFFSMMHVRGKLITEEKSTSTILSQELCKNTPNTFFTWQSYAKPRFRFMLHSH
jgi:hypothetical protein